MTISGVVVQVVSGNCRLLFHKDPLCREEAATRLLWLTRLSHLPHKKLVDVYLIDSSVTSHTPIAGMYEVCHGGYRSHMTIIINIKVRFQF